MVYQINILAELLRNKGFDDELVNNAESICKNISETKNILTKKIQMNPIIQ